MKTSYRVIITMENIRPVYPNVMLTIDKSSLTPFQGDHRYFTFDQNNSGGSFDYDENYGDHVIIAAKNSDHANERAQEIGLYFNGAHENGPDCECCGDRWYAANGEGDLTPQIYSKRPEALLAEGGWFRDLIVVHHADGSRETYRRIDEKKR